MVGLDVEDAEWDKVKWGAIFFLAPKTEYIYQVAQMNFDVGLGVNRPTIDIDNGAGCLLDIDLCQELARQNEQVEKQREKMTEFWRFGRVWKNHQTIKP